MIRFADITVDPQNFDVKSNGQSVDVEPLIFDLLLLLASNPGQVYSKDELMQEIWKGRVVSDATIASAIKNVRKAIGDSGKEQKYIKTIHGRGFQFVADISAYPSSEAAEKSSSISSVSIQDYQPCLLIMPFKSLSADSQLQSGIDALKVDLERVFSRVPLLNISAAGSHYAAMQLMPSPRQIFQQTAATHLLEGNVQSYADQMIVNVQLTDTKLGFRIWSEQFNVGISKDQNPITELVVSIVRRFEPKLNQSIYDAIVSMEGVQSTRSLYLQASGLLAIKGWHSDTFVEAADTLRQCLKLTDKFVYAPAYLSLLLAFGHRIGLLSERERNIKESILMAEQALSISAQDSTVLGFVGCAFCDMGNAERGQPLLRKAIDANQANGQAWVALGASHLLEGNDHVAIEKLQHGINISPLDSRLAVWQALLAVAKIKVGDFEGALMVAEQACQNDDKIYMPRVVLAACRLAMNDIKGAKSAFSEANRVKADLSCLEIDALIGTKTREKLVNL